MYPFQHAHPHGSFDLEQKKVVVVVCAAETILHMDRLSLELFVLATFVGSTVVALIASAPLAVYAAHAVLAALFFLLLNPVRSLPKPQLWFDLSD